MPRFVPVTLGSPRFRNLATQWFNVVHAWFPPDEWLAPHEHEHANLAVMLTGSFDLTLLGRTLPCPPGTVLIEPPGERHANRMGQFGAEVVVIQPGSRAREVFGAATDLLFQPGHMLHGGIATSARTIVSELDRGDQYSPLAIEGHALEMVAALARAPGRGLDGGQPPWLRTVLDLLHEDIPTSLRIDHLARLAGVDPVALARAFRRHLGMPIGTYARQLRLDRCAAALRATREPIAALAIRAGFADQSHLTRAFRQRFGLTPDAYRRAHRGPGHTRAAQHPLTSRY
jgi:AraC family transcriptional regulator